MNKRTIALLSATVIAAITIPFASTSAFTAQTAAPAEAVLETDVLPETFLQGTFHVAPDAHSYTWVRDSPFSPSSKQTQPGCAGTSKDYGRWTPSALTPTTAVLWLKVSTYFNNSCD